MKQPDKASVGALGEKLIAKFLMEDGFEILDTNYRKPWGEIDIVARRDGKLRFVEVKAMRKTGASRDYRPEDHVGLWKKERLSRVIRTYLVEKRISENTDFEIVVAAILLDFEHKKATIRLVENVILG
ncbi:MAG TPA: YraN family protein [Patescibacteria group bacterium]|nr:YraN family protein [Patescibacteria group bacterium]